MVIKYSKLIIRDIYTYLVNQQTHTDKICIINVHVLVYCISVNMYYSTDMEHIKQFMLIFVLKGLNSSQTAAQS